MNEKWREGQLPGMSAYVLAADIFDIWAYLAENSESAADRVEQAIYDAARFSRKARCAAIPGPTSRRVHFISGR
jgi:hypothetical protein